MSIYTNSYKSFNYYQNSSHQNGNVFELHCHYTHTEKNLNTLKYTNSNINTNQFISHFHSDVHKDEEHPLVIRQLLTKLELESALSPRV